MTKIIYLFLLLFSVTAFAHTGVDRLFGLIPGLSHPFSGLDHLLTMIAIGLWATQVGESAIWAIPSSFLFMMVTGGFLAYCGVHFPFVEQGILLSVLFMGAFLAAAIRMPVVAGALVAGLFGLFHGHAHGLEIPHATSAYMYSLGFVASTAALHISGIIAALSFVLIET